MRRPPFIVILSAGFGMNFGKPHLETSCEDTGKIMSKISMTNQISFINCLASAGVRGFCTV